ncbi:MAG: hypothetical protein ACOX7O_06265 [Oscillospiraceae bacterium]|jgi:hypothetical protein
MKAKLTLKNAGFFFFGGFVALLLVILLWVGLGELRYINEKAKLHSKICDNLVSSQWIQTDKCLDSKDIYQVMTHYFPPDVSVKYVTDGMEGIKLVTLSKKNAYEGCIEPITYTYAIARPWPFFFRAEAEFSFCDGHLTRMSVRD